MHLQAYVVTALQMFSLDAVNATEFLEVYKGVVPPGEFSGMLDELTSGASLRLSLIADAAMLMQLAACYTKHITHQRACGFRQHVNPSCRMALLHLAIHGIAIPNNYA